MLIDEVLAQLVCIRPNDKRLEPSRQVFLERNIAAGAKRGTVLIAVFAH